MIKFNDRHLDLHVPRQLVMGARNEHVAQLWQSCVRDIVFSQWKRKPLLTLPFTDREPLTSTGGCVFRRVLSLPQCFQSAVFLEWPIAALCFFRLIHLSHFPLRRGRNGKSLIWKIYVSGRLSVRTPPSKGAVIRPKQMVFSRQFTERKAWCPWNTRPLLISPVIPRSQSDAGTFIWFLDHSPVSKGLVCTLSLHLLLVFFLIERRPALQLLYRQRMRIPCDAIDMRGRLDCEIILPDRSSKYWQTDPRKSAKNCPILGKAYMFKVEFR